MQINIVVDIAGGDVGAYTFFSSPRFVPRQRLMGGYVCVSILVRGCPHPAYKYCITYNAVRGRVHSHAAVLRRMQIVVFRFTISVDEGRIGIYLSDMMSERGKSKCPSYIAPPPPTPPPSLPIPTPPILSLCPSPTDRGVFPSAALCVDGSNKVCHNPIVCLAYVHAAS